jgi:hypothetical protein
MKGFPSRRATRLTPLTRFDEAAQVRLNGGQTLEGAEISAGSRGPPARFGQVARDNATGGRETPQPDE